MEEEAQKAGAEGTPAANEGAGEQKPVRVRPKFNPLAIALNVSIPPAVCAGIGIGVYDSPTSATHSFSPMSNEMPRTA